MRVMKMYKILEKTELNPTVTKMVIDALLLRNAQKLDNLLFYVSVKMGNESL